MCPETFNLRVAAERILYMHDGAPGHFSRAVRDVLSNTCHDRRIGTGERTVWPPRSPDLNPLDFYLSGHLNNLVYAPPVDNEETLQHRTVDDVRLCATTPTSLNGCCGPWWDMSRSALNLIEDVLSYNSQIASGLTLIWTFFCFIWGTRGQNLLHSVYFTFYSANSGHI
jgi:hypothetical protein